MLRRLFLKKLTFHSLFISILVNSASASINFEHNSYFKIINIFSLCISILVNTTKDSIHIELTSYLKKIGICWNSHGLTIHQSTTPSLSQTIWPRWVQPLSQLHPYHRLFDQDGSNPYHNSILITDYLTKMGPTLLACHPRKGGSNFIQ